VRSRRSPGSLKRKLIAWLEEFDRNRECYMTSELCRTLASFFCRFGRRISKRLHLAPEILLFIRWLFFLLYFIAMSFIMEGM